MHSVGGAIEKTDTEPVWKKIVNDRPSNIKVDGDSFEYGIVPDRLFSSIDEFAFRIGAIRELFEEANVLVASTQNVKLSKDILINWRDLVTVGMERWYLIWSSERQL